MKPGESELTSQQLATVLDAHRTWIESDGREGQRADFTRIDLDGAELARANLQGADLSGAKLRRADLRGAILADADLAGANAQGAELPRANLRGALLARANFRDANLAEADLTDSQGLLAGQLGGANLAACKLPGNVTFEGLANVTESSKTTQGLFTSVILVCVYTWLSVASTRDSQLLNNAAPPSSRLPILGTDIPLVQFYLVAPLLLFCLYVYFHLCLQRLWEELAELPAVFPDGRPLDKKAYPWLLNVLVRGQLARLRDNLSYLARAQTSISVLLAWGLVPLTILFLWLRYLRAHDWLVTGLHVVALALSVGVGFGFWNLASATLRGSERRPFLWQRSWRDARTRSVVAALTCGVVLAVLSFGAIDGVNPLAADRGVDAQAIRPLWAVDLRQWVPKLFMFAGFNPFAQLDDVALSTKPSNWAGGHTQAEFDGVRGADLEGKNLRFGLAYNAFLVNSFFKRADMRGTDLRTADLRKADFREADLRGTNFRGANVEGTDFRWADLTGAKLVETKGKGALFEGAKGLNARFTRGDLRGADFTDAQLAGADFSGADLTGAKGLTTEQLATAKLDAETKLPDGLSLPKLARKE